MIRCSTYKPGKRKPWMSMDWKETDGRLHTIDILLRRWPKVELTDNDGTRYVYTRVEP